MKRVLVISTCVPRGTSIGLVGELLYSLAKLDKNDYYISLYNINFFDSPLDSSTFPVDEYFYIHDKLLYRLARKVPVFRAFFAVYVIGKKLKIILSSKKYDYVIFHQIPIFVDLYVEIAHSNGAKVIFEPFGSDILRVGGIIKKHLIRGFNYTDAVVGRKLSNVLIASKEIYKVPDEKIFVQREVVKGVQKIKELKGKRTREEMCSRLGIPFLGYNIVCGYTARESHRHKEIINSLAKVKDCLPPKHLIIIPMTYGAVLEHTSRDEYAKELEMLGRENGLNIICLLDFLSEEQIAYLHLVTDLFIEIQPTDNGNAFMIESLYAKNIIITGRWLNYVRFEQFGEPYYLLDKPEDLPSLLRGLFTGTLEKKTVPQALLDFFDVPDGYDKSAFWRKMFKEL